MGMILALCIGAAQAAPADRVEEHLQACLDEAKAKLCEAEKDQFREAFADAYRGDYQGQRNVAFCLKSGCGGCLYPGCGGIQRNATLACAWRMVILKSGSSSVDETDRMNVKVACGGLSRAEAATAEAQADRLMRTIRMKR